MESHIKVEKVKAFLKNNYSHRVSKMTRLGEARTTDAFKVTFDSGDEIILKVSYDPQDILEKKGEKEVKVLQILEEGLTNALPVPKVDQYLESNEFLPGYVISLKVLPGKALSVKDFNDIACSDENIQALAESIFQVHNIKFEKMTDFAGFIDKTLDQYIDKYRSKWEKYLIEAHFPKEIINKLADLEHLKSYFSDFPISLLHKDIKFNNVLVKDKHISGIVDWEGAFAGPIPFEFAHTKILSRKYGYTVWMEKLINKYQEICANPFLGREVSAMLLFTSFRYMCRSHASEKNSDAENAVYINEILKWKFPF